MYPKSYRKKPVVVRAMQWDGTVESGDEIVEWIEFMGGHATNLPAGYDSNENLIANAAIEVDTLEGKTMASKYDYVVCGTSGEFYPVKPNIFVDCYISDLDFERDYLFEAECMIDQEARTNPRYQPGAALFAQIGLAQQVKRVADALTAKPGNMTITVINDKTKPLHMEK